MKVLISACCIVRILTWTWMNVHLLAWPSGAHAQSLLLSVHFNLARYV
jgi:hypothetical protein